MGKLKNIPIKFKMNIYINIKKKKNENLYKQNFIEYQNLFIVNEICFLSLLYLKKALAIHSTRT